MAATQIVLATGFGDGVCGFDVSSDSGSTFEGTAASNLYTDGYQLTCTTRNNSCILYGTGNTSSEDVAFILYSRDGNQWAYIVTNYKYIMDIHWTGTQFVMIGIKPSTGAIASAISPDGINWTYGSDISFEFSPLFSNTNYNHNIAYNGTRYIVPVDCYGFITSTDGLTWQVLSTPPVIFQNASDPGLYSARHVIWDGTRFIAISNANASHSIGYSTDGLTWISGGNTLHTPQNATFKASIAYNGSIWLASVYHSENATVNCLVKSTDGMEWTTTSISQWPWFISPKGAIIKAHNSTFYMGCSLQGIGENKIFTTTDGETVTQLSSFSGLPFSVGNVLSASLPTGDVDIVISGRFPITNTNVSVDISGSGFVGVASVGSGLQPTRITHNGSMWVMAVWGSNTRDDFIYYSADGKTWTLATSATDCFGGQYSGGVVDIIWDGSKFIAVGWDYSLDGPNNYGKIAHSTDGINWSTTGVVLNPNDENDGFTCISYNGSIYVAGCWWGTGLYSSTDGLTWTPTSNDVFPPSGYGEVYRIATDGSKFMAWGFGADYIPTIASSTDGLTWTAVSLSITPSDVTYGNGKWVVVGDGVETSTDGVTWTTTIASNFDSELIAFDGSKFIAQRSLLNRHYLCTSTDGETFTPIHGAYYTQRINAIGTRVAGSSTPPVPESEILNPTDVTTVLAVGETKTISVGAATVSATLFQEGSPVALNNGVAITGLPTGGYLLAGVVSTSTSTSRTLLIKAYDASGAPITGSSLNIAVSLPKTLFATNPSTLNVFSRTSSSDPWVSEGTATLVGNNYEFTITHTTQYSFQTPVPNFTSANAIPQKIVYDQTVQVALDNNEINLADSSNYGHRVVVEVPVADLNGETEWTRAVGSLYPVGALKATFTDKLLTALGTSYVDMDAQADGLNFSSSAINSVADPRLRLAGNTVNDWVVAYVLYKLYGKSSFETASEVFNIEDVQNMLENVTVTTAISDSLTAHSSSVQKLFRDLLVSDPKRFFDASGVQLPGLFETNPAAEPTTGSWQLTNGDSIEIRLEFEFGDAITRRNVADSQLNTSTAGGSTAATREIAAGEKFYVRLQVTAA